MGLFDRGFHHPGRPRVRKQCVMCGAEFETLERTRKYCNETCGIKAATAVAKRKRDARNNRAKSDCTPSE